MPSSDEATGPRGCSEDETNEWFRKNADPDLVQASVMGLLVISNYAPAVAG